MHITLLCELAEPSKTTVYHVCYSRAVVSGIWATWCHNPWLLIKLMLEGEVFSSLSSRLWLSLAAGASVMMWCGLWVSVWTELAAAPFSNLAEIAGSAP